MANLDHLYRAQARHSQHLASFFLDPDGTILNWDAGVASILGYSEPEFLGRSISIIFLPADIAAKLPALERAIAAAQGQASGVRWHACKDGRPVFLESVLTALRGDNGDLLGFSHCLRKVTGQTSPGGLLEAILESTDDAIFVKSRDGKYLFANAITARTIGREKEEILGRSDGELFPSEVSGALWNTDDSIMSAGDSRTIEETLPTPGRGLRVYLSTKASWRDGSGNVVGLIGIARDITDRKHNEQALQNSEATVRELLQNASRANAALTRSNEDLDHFAAIVSHDLQEPLRTVAVYTGLLARRYKHQLDANAQQYIDHTLSASRRMQTLIQHLLAYSRVTSAADAIIERVDAEETLRRTLANLQGVIQQSGAVISFDPLPSVQAAPDHLAQVFQNLIGNAIKYRRGETPRIHISARLQGPEWIFAVEDNGIGFLARQEEQIFGIFKRLHDKEFPGDGIGLAVCKRIIERHQGRIWAESRPNEGSTFFFTLPA